MLPAAVTAAAASAAYQVLLEPTLDGGVQSTTSGNTAVVHAWTSKYGSVYYLVQYTASGVQTISGNYKEIGTFSASGYAKARNMEGKYGVIDANGKTIVDFIYNDMDDTTDDDYVVVYEDGYSYYSSTTWTLLNLKTGTSTTVSTAQGWNRGYSDGVMLICVDNDNEYSYQYYSIDGSVAISTVYDYATVFSNNYAVVRTVGSDVYEVINTKGETVNTLKDVNLSYNSISKEGLLWVETDKSQGYIDVTTGEMKIKRKDDYGGNFVNGYAMVEKYSNSKWTYGLIDANGNMVIPYGRYKDFSDVSDTGLVWATVDYSSNKVAVIQLGGSSQSGTTSSGTSSIIFLDTEDGIEIGVGNTVPYTGKAQKPDVTVSYVDDNGVTQTLTPKDYTVKYSNNKNAAEADDKNAPTVTVTLTKQGQSKYTFTGAGASANGTKATATFTIEKGALDSNGVSDTITTTYTGAVPDASKVIKGSVKSGSKTVKGKWTWNDFDDVNAGTYENVSATFTPTDKNYAPITKEFTVEITPAKVSVKKVAVAAKTVTQVSSGAEAKLSSTTSVLKGLVKGDTFDSVAKIEFDPYTPTDKKGSQKLGYTITLTSPNYTFGDQDGNTKTGTVTAKILAG
jgi:hypothetical protein